MIFRKQFYLFKLAWKNICRHIGRSFFIGISVSISVIMAVWIMSLFSGMNEQLKTSVIECNVGNYQVQDPDFSKSENATRPLKRDDQFLKKLTSQVGVRAYSPELVVDGYVNSSKGSLPLYLIGVIPDLSSKVFNLEKNITNGSYFTDKFQPGIIIGNDLAEFYQLTSGDNLIFHYQDKDGELRAEILPIIGVFEKNGAAFEKRHAYINKHVLEKLFMNGNGNWFNRIVIKSNPHLTENKLQSITKEVYPQAKIKDWEDINPEISVVIQFHHGMINFFFLIIAITITLTILTPISMLWQERTHELKMMKILGTKSSKIWSMGFYECFQMIFGSCSVALLVLFVLISIQNKTGVNFSEVYGNKDLTRAGIELPQTIYPIFESQQVIATILFVAGTVTTSYILAIKSTLKKIRGR